jgi:flagellar M-ring protein FliF
MDFLNQAIAQVNDLFRSMTPGARITAGLLLAVVVVSVGYLFQTHSAGPDEFLFGGAYLPDGQLNQIEAAIGQAGLSDYRREGNRMLVPRGQKAAYLAAVADAGALPPNFHTYLEDAIDQGGPWESSTATRMRLQIAKQGMLSDIIRHMDWVEDAVVLYDEQPPHGLKRTKLVTGSVNVKPILGEVLDTRRATMLQKLVAHAVVGMRPDDVAVTNLGDAGTPGSDGGFFPDDFKTDYYQARVTYEQYKKQSILNALRDIEGVRVEVSAELDDIAQETVQSITPEKQGTAVRALTVNEKSTQGTTDGGGQVGATAQGPTRQGTSEQLARQTQSETTKDTEEVDNLVGREQSTHLRAGFTPKEVWATVTIPRRYIETVWKQRNPDAKDAPTDDAMRIVQEDIVTKVENIVAPLLDRQNKGENQYKQVQVVVLDSIAAPEIEPPSMANTAMAWAGRYWTTLAMIVVAMFSLLVLKSVVTATPQGGGADAPAITPTLTVQSEDVEPESAADDDQPQRTRLKIKKGASLKDDLADMVKEDPDAAAAILRSWIGKAG